MANINNKEEPSTAPKPDQWYNLSLGSSFKDHHPSSKFCTLRYEFKPASIDKNQPGKLHKTKDNKISVEFQNNQPGKPKVTFDGSSEDYKENDAVLFFDGESFRLERLHTAVKRLRYNRLPGESAASAAAVAAPAPAPARSPAPASVSAPVGMPVETSSPLAKGAKFPSLNKPALPALPVEVERIDVGDFRSSDSRPKNEKIAEYPSSIASQSAASPDMNELEEELDILNDDEDDTTAHNGGNITVKEFETGIDINIPHQNDTDDEIADVVSDDDQDKGRNAAEELRAQVDAAEKVDHTSSSSSSSGSDSSGSGSGSESGSDSASSSSDSESSDTVNSI